MTVSGLEAELWAHRMLVLHDALRHIEIVAIAVAFGAVIAIPLGILLTRRPRVAEPVIAIMGFLQTVPSLALLALVLPILGIGLVPAVTAMALYALLPILRNTYVGLRGVSPALIDAARGVGMSPFQVLTKVELPMSMSVIIAGVRLSTIYIISWAVLAALIGAGGLGIVIFEGMSTYDYGLILAGAIPAAVLAILAGILFNILKRYLTPVGLRRAGGQAR